MLSPVITQEGASLVAQVYPVAIILIVLEGRRVRKDIRNAAHAVLSVLSIVVKAGAIVGAIFSVALCVWAVTSSTPLSVNRSSIVILSGYALVAYASLLSLDLVLAEWDARISKSDWFQNRNKKGGNDSAKKGHPETETKGQKRRGEPSQMELAAYAAVVSRRNQWDNLVWQVPLLSLTAQAFLFSIALGPDASDFARYVASGLSIVVTVLSVGLMARHRQAEVTDAHWLAAFEERLPAHLHNHGPEWAARRDRVQLDHGWTEKVVPLVRGYPLWVAGLLIFGLAALGIILVTLFAPDLLSSPPPREG